MGIEAAFTTLDQRVREGRATKVHGALGLGFAHTVARLSARRPVVVIARSETAADDVQRDLMALFSDREAVLRLPADDRSPYHKSSPDPLVVMKRAATLFKIASGTEFKALVTSPRAIARKQLPLSVWNDAAELLMVGEELERDVLCQRLGFGGYAQVNFVEDPGTFALRGSILDIFWPGFKRPFRVDLFGDEIESIKFFNPESQRTLDAVEDLAFGPAREVHLTQANVARAKPVLRDLADDLEHPTKAVRNLIDDLENGIPVFGVEGLLPALNPALQSTLDIVSRATKGALVVLDDGPSVQRAVHDLNADFAAGHRTAVSRGDLVFPPEAHLLEWEEIEDQLASAVDFRDLGVASDDVLELRIQSTAEVRSEVLRESARKDDVGNLLKPLANRVRTLHREGRAVFIPVASLGGLDRVTELLRAHQLEVRKWKNPRALISDDLKEVYPAIGPRVGLGGRPGARARGRPRARRCGGHPRGRDLRKARATLGVDGQKEGLQDFARRPRGRRLRRARRLWRREVRRPQATLGPRRRRRLRALALCGRRQALPARPPLEPHSAVLGARRQTTAPPTSSAARRGAPSATRSKRPCSPSHKSC